MIQLCGGSIVYVSCNGLNWLYQKMEIIRIFAVEIALGLRRCACGRKLLKSGRYFPTRPCK